MVAAQDTSGIPGINADDAKYLRWPGVVGEEKIQALEAVAAGGGLQEAARAARCHAATVIHWRQRDEAFADCWNQAFKAGVQLYEVELHKRALAGTEDPASWNALSKVLNARDRQAYGEQSKLVHDGGVRVESVIIQHEPQAKPPLPPEAS